MTLLMPQKNCSGKWFNHPPGRARHGARNFGLRSFRGEKITPIYRKNVAVLPEFRFQTAFTAIYLAKPKRICPNSKKATCFEDTIGLR
jgi:hypothetical protein